MNIGFFIVGGIIFSVYIGLTLWNIYDSSKKSKEENYPNKK
jgi:CHASE3 domain sensor protein